LSAGPPGEAGGVLPFRRQPAASPLGALARGTIAGLAGTAVVTAVMLVEERFGVPGARVSPGDPESWEEAPAPAQVGQRVAEGVFDRPLPVASAPLVGSAVHWAYGAAWGALYGLVAETRRPPWAPAGAVLGLGVWAAGHAGLLPAAGLAPPFWRQPHSGAGFAAANHVLFGLATARVEQALAAR
jgi:hypothetical protein